MFFIFFSQLFKVTTVCTLKLIMEHPERISAINMVFLFIDLINDDQMK